MKQQKIIELYYSNNMNDDPDSMKIMNFILSVESELAINLLELDIGKITDLDYIKGLAVD